MVLVSGKRSMKMIGRQGIMVVHFFEIHDFFSPVLGLITAVQLSSCFCSLVIVEDFQAAQTPNKPRHVSRLQASIDNVVMQPVRHGD